MNTVMGSVYTPKEKFIVYSENTAVISDYNFYMRNQEDLESWCKDNCPDWRREGMMLFFKTSEERTMFLLRWAS